MVKRFYYGWVCVGAGFLIQFLYGVHYAFGLFLEPLAGLAGLTIITVHGVAYCVERGIARETATYIFGIMGLPSRASWAAACLVITWCAGAWLPSMPAGTCWPFRVC
ncbi:MAG: hypothetical protein PWQ18_1204 [Clostridia bacterium]|nr:hypothetical protein [Clostridia bacterium]